MQENQNTSNVITWPTTKHATHYKRTTFDSSVKTWPLTNKTFENSPKSNCVRRWFKHQWWWEHDGRHLRWPGSAGRPRWVSFGKNQKFPGRWKVTRGAYASPLLGYAARGMLMGWFYGARRAVFVVGSEKTQIFGKAQQVFFSNPTYAGVLVRLYKR